jgi:hypothetical protein
MELNTFTERKERVKQIFERDEGMGRGRGGENCRYVKE